ncbi:plastocyanin-like domain-containing [Trichoderma cornu-damae]|uniref:Plastocyanin-like domain-containing n=1 Tax=Trichoderma cornu-damae TaxID=654480 RepID=A0A9P8QLU7_9HYPO|nr:plastocyanin-like domain-containing [Trichoderma cornu-damae]
MIATKVFALLAAAIASVSAFPAGTPTVGNTLASRTGWTGVTHSVVAGRGGLHFDPDNIVAEVGDVVEIHFTAKNHSVAQSDFAHPCKPLADGSGFFAGFNFVTAEGQNPNVYQFTVLDKDPIWFYCPQTTGNHCQNGMTAVVNQNFNSDKTLANQRVIAAGTGVSVVPAYIQGGRLGGFQRANPNPLSGF